MRKSKLYSMVLVALLLSLTFSPQMATAAEIPLRASDYIDVFRASAQPIGYGLVRIDFQIAGTSVMNQLGASEIQIKEKTGASWTTVRTYRHESYPDLMGQNVLRHTGSITFPGIAGRTYVAHITFYAANTKGSETQVITTSSVTAY
ncbi:MAG TPA: hypothetical protein DDZ53_03375 [Firmicutes bacterium]|nr:hypothetical protein [Bacillota bacterium]